jgi:diacylglycerol kinase family enzyme
MKHIFIVNPVAGKTDAFKMLEDIYYACIKNDIDCEILFTSCAGDAKTMSAKYAADNKECIIYSVGGDGTLNEVVNGIVNTNAILGVIPSGSGNDFFRMLSDSKEDALNRTINGDIDNINIGKVNNNHFINIASLGYDAEAAAGSALAFPSFFGIKASLPSNKMQSKMPTPRPQAAP